MEFFGDADGVCALIICWLLRIVRGGLGFVGTKRCLVGMSTLGVCYGT